MQENKDFILREPFLDQAWRNYRMNQLEEATENFNLRAQNASHGQTHEFEKTLYTTLRERSADL